jgi:hypothetical protein
MSNDVMVLKGIWLAIIVLGGALIGGLPL